MRIFFVENKNYSVCSKYINKVEVNMDRILMLLVKWLIRLFVIIM